MRARALAAVLVATAFAVGSAAAQPTQAGPDAPTYVIVHGAWGCGCSFAALGDSLAARGHRVHRPSLTGLGDRVHLATPEVGLTTHVDDVVNLLRFEDLHDVVLVGHSYGGMVITAVADREPARIRRLVYLDALLPDSGETAMELLGAERFDALTRDGYLVPTWVAEGTPPPHDVPHPRRSFVEPVSLTGAGAGVPGTFILTREAGAAEDRFDPFAERARRRGWEVQEMEAGHNPHLTALPELLRRLAAIR